MQRIYISHAPHDDDVADRIHEKLTAAGIDAWSDNVDVDSEGDWLERVKTAVKQASHGLFLLSPAALRSPAAIKECRRLLAEQKPLFVALIEEVDEDDLPYFLDSRRILDFVEDFEDGVKQLIDMMQQGGGGRLAGLSSLEQREAALTLQADLRDLDVSSFIDLLARLIDAGIKDITVINAPSR